MNWPSVGALVLMGSVCACATATSGAIPDESSDTARAANGGAGPSAGSSGAAHGGVPTGSVGRAGSAAGGSSSGGALGSVGHASGGGGGALAPRVRRVAGIRELVPEAARALRVARPVLRALPAA